jgi:hypothetical protein
VPGSDDRVGSCIGRGHEGLSGDFVHVRVYGRRQRDFRESSD